MYTFMQIITLDFALWCVDDMHYQICSNNMWYLYKSQWWINVMKTSVQRKMTTGITHRNYAHPQDWSTPLPMPTEGHWTKSSVHRTRGIQAAFFSTYICTFVWHLHSYSPKFLMILVIFPLINRPYACSMHAHAHSSISTVT